MNNTIRHLPNGDFEVLPLTTEELNETKSADKEQISGEDTGSEQVIETKGA